MAEAAEEERVLQEAVDRLDKHLEVNELLARRGLAQPMGLLLGAEEATDLLARAVGEAGAGQDGGEVAAAAAAVTADDLLASARGGGGVLGGGMRAQAVHSLLEAMVEHCRRADAAAMAGGGAEPGHEKGEKGDWAGLLSDMVTVRDGVKAAGRAALPLRAVLRAWTRGALRVGQTELVKALVLRQGAALCGAWGEGPLEPLDEAEPEAAPEAAGAHAALGGNEAAADVAAAADFTASCVPALRDQLSASDVRELVLLAVREWTDSAAAVDHPAVARAAECLATFDEVLALQPLPHAQQTWPTAGERSEISGGGGGAGASAALQCAALGRRRGEQLEALQGERRLLRACSAFAALLGEAGSASESGSGFHVLPLQLRLAADSADDRAQLLLGACDAVRAPHERASAVHALVDLLELPAAVACAARERLCRAALRFGNIRAAAAEALALAAANHPPVWDACEVLAGSAALAGP
ncbi:hypothetical protein T492DRAFT_905600, partial [Pavlovales sp. CCMP2436]